MVAKQVRIELTGRNYVEEQTPSKVSEQKSKVPSIDVCHKFYLLISEVSD